MFEYDNDGDEGYYSKIRGYNGDRMLPRYVSRPSKNGGEVFIAVAQKYSQFTSSYEKVDAFRSPFQTNETSENFTGYSSSTRRKAISDRWIYGFASMVDNLMSAASGGLIWILVVLFFIFFLVCSFWVAVLSIPSVKSTLEDKSVSASLATLGFVVAIITSDAISRRERAILMPLRRYNRLVISIRSLHQNIYSVFRSKMIQFDRIIFDMGSKRGGQRFNDQLKILYQWLALASSTLSTTSTYLQLMAVWSLRVFLKIDPILDYEDFGITQRELDYSINLPFEEYGYVKKDPVTIMSALLRRQKEQIQATTEKLTKGVPSVNESQSNLLQNGLESVGLIFHEIEVARNVSQPRIFAASKNFVLIFFLLVIIPIDIFSSVDVLTLIIGPLVLFLFSMMLIVLWYIGSAFSPYPRWEGPRFYEWRRDLYASIYHDERRYVMWATDAKRILDSLAEGHPPDKPNVVDIVDLRMIASDDEDDARNVEYSWRRKR
jgi:hypothetical protein